MWKVIRYIVIGVLFFAAVFFNVNNTIDTMESSEQARIADIGDSMAEALESAAVNVLEKNLDPNMKTRGISVLKDTDENGNSITIDQVKDKVSREVAAEFKDYQTTFNREITVGNGVVKPLYDYEILSPAKKLGGAKKTRAEVTGINGAGLKDFGSEVNTGSYGSRFDNYGQGGIYANITGGDSNLEKAGDTRDREKMKAGAYPQYNATLRIRFYSIMKSKNYKKIDASGNTYGIKEQYGPPYELDYPISVTIRHVNTEDENYN